MSAFCAGNGGSSSCNWKVQDYISLPPSSPGSFSKHVYCDSRLQLLTWVKSCMSAELRLSSLFLGDPEQVRHANVDLLLTL